MILVTGSNGLIGSALVRRLTERGCAVREFDLVRSPREDVRDPVALAAAVEQVEGIVHLAAISRVVWAENDPGLARMVNTDALASLIRIVLRQRPRPWFVFASSREVYGECSSLPASEDAPFRPLNTYARLKVEGERLVEQARAAGVTANVVRFSNVYGSILDHADRVVPAFARSAAEGGALRIDGPDNMFDFTHVDDVVAGLLTHVDATRAGEALPPVHFVTGAGTTLGELARTAAAHARSPLAVKIAPPRHYDVARFVGDPARARSLLGWAARIGIDEGFARLTRAFENDRTVTPAETTDSVAERSRPAV